MPLTLEAEISPGVGPREVQELAGAVERAGFDRLGVSDVALWPDTFVVQALCALATERVQIGAMVTNPYSRHPAALAAAVASLQELSGGRAFLGIGVGAGLEPFGIDYPRPVATLRGCDHDDPRAPRGRDLRLRQQHLPGSRRAPASCSRATGADLDRDAQPRRHAARG